MKYTVEVIAYDPNWVKQFEMEAAFIQAALGQNCIKVHHIGSTSVPGLSAKPIIDIIPVVKDIVQVDSIAENMEKRGYESKGEHGMLFRRFFQKPGYNIHVYEAGNPVIERHLMFRDWMRMRDTDRDAYAKLKENLALKYPNDLFNYCLAKDDFVAGIDVKTGFNGLHIVKALTPREWESVKRFCEISVFNDAMGTRSMTATFDNPDHIHWVLYQGGRIIGYANIQISSPQDAQLCFIIIDESQQHQGNGRVFLSQCERWLKLQGIKTLQVKCPKKTEAFFRKEGYTAYPIYQDDQEDRTQFINIQKVLLNKSSIGF